MIRIVILALAVLVGGCGSGATARPGVTEDPVLTTCRSGVLHANQNAHDDAGLDLALAACGSLAQLEQAMRDDPGYLAAGADPQAFAATRCAYATVLSAALICRELSILGSAPPAKPATTPKPTKKPAAGKGYYRPPGWNGSADVGCKDFDTYAHAQSFFKGTGGSKTKDPYKLDPDHDGLACEGLR